MGRRNEQYIFAPEKQRRGGAGCFVVFLLVVVALVATGLLINNASNGRVVLSEERVSIMSLNKTYEGFTVLHLSDLQASELGNDPTLWRSLLYGKKWNAVVLSGDMVGASGEYVPLQSLIHTLLALNPTAPVYFIAGDEDPAPVISTPSGSPEVLAEWVRAAVSEGAIYLDAPMPLAVGKQTVWFVPELLYDVDAAGMQKTLTLQKEQMEASGQQYESAGGATYRSVCYRLDAMERTVAAQNAMLSTDIQIAVTHAPLSAAYIRTGIEWADQAKPFNFRAINLLLAGHYCGGQWRLPGGGAIYVPELGWLPSDDGLRGLQRVNSMNQYISPGLGASGEYPYGGRLFNPPTVTLLRLTGTIN